MLFKRKILNEIYKWQESLKIKKRALVIIGLRQVGKTTIVQEFCKKNYDNVVYINFMNNASIKKAFDGDLIVDDMIRDLSGSLIGTKFIPNKTVIIFDELQECANARSAIKPFMLDGRFDIIATGSLIGLRGYNKKKCKGIPTGFEYFLELYSLDFEEYLCVGGMPDAVNTFLLTKDLNQVYDIQHNILEQYKDDFGKHLDEFERETINKVELNRIMQVYNSIPNQLTKKKKKFQYSVIGKHAKGSEYRDAITWLEEFGLINICYNLNTLELPLEGNKIDNDFKLYVADTGLFVSMLERETVGNILNGNLKVYKGAIFENIIADALTKLGKKLYFYSKTSGLEIDFFEIINNELTLVEVKSTNGNSKSLKEVLNNKKYNNVSKAVKLIDGNIGYINNIYTIPLYMAFLLK